ncbi:MAG: YXWGXW repeat-containing protein [Candidatus Hydrogenedentes bacterium]|nr:YXWGXW repeat-containing protein [Candidatus Hydrogenedentota bacterium]
MKRFRSIRSILCAASLGSAACVSAWSAETTVVVAPAAPGETATVVTQTTVETPAAKEVTVVKETTKPAQFRHEALMDSAGNIIDSILVKVAPPEVKKEVMRIETRPAENAVWVPGYWQWDAGKTDYDWVPGTWRRAIPGMTWNTGHWAKSTDGYEWSPGFWAAAAAAPATTTTTTATTRAVRAHDAPPAPKVEVKSESPGADKVWIPGNWSYEKGEYVWSSGRWERPAAEQMSWSPARWRHTSEGYELVPGHWEYPTEIRTYVVSTEKSEKR